MQPFQPAVPVRREELSAEALAKLHPELTVEHAQRLIDEALKGDLYVNDMYQVLINRLPAGKHGLGNCIIVHLSIKRIDREPVHDWRDLQEIKNMLVGVPRPGAFDTCWLGRPSGGLQLNTRRQAASERR